MIIIEDYNPDWPTLFSQEKAMLEHVLKGYVCGNIEHVGSTAVPGLAAKPVIDIMVGIASLVQAKPAIALMQEYGYCYHSYKGDVMHWFCKPSPDIRTHHVHLVPFNSPLWHDRITFRNRLRQSPELANRYEVLKRQLASKSGGDREAYTQAKTAFVNNALSQK
jgi:GrpB-like predicted nucleotidyltransferase (UPF0157 family)